jgi:hypothetical protein
MANSRAVTNRVTDLGRILPPVDRRVVVEFFRVFMFLFVLPNVSDETNNTRSSRRTMRTTFSAWPKLKPGTKLLKGF